ncbi:porin family protein [Dyadobacter sp. CY261]|uniref:porin family protein n=1 Tax=Dyadobacter sp. CY261 TaxID=2907203 RepID=UPI001F2F1A8D|nr:porin family protein [Dyadobacter sp. CY261]MCF0072343.1 porin family protein [Dyadobacter sp. CY261]
MIELPDDELDKLFRKSSEELDPTYEPDDWNDLRKRLDQQDGRSPAGWWRKWWPVGVLALLIPVGIVLYRVSGENGGKEKGGRAVVLKGENGRTDERTKEGGPGRDVFEGKSGSSEVVREPGVVKDATREGAIVDNGTPTVDKGNKLVEKHNSAVDNGSKVVDSGNKVFDNKKTDISNKLKTRTKRTGKSSSNSDLNAAVVNGRKLLPRSRSKAGGVYLEPNRSKVEGGDGAFSIANKLKTSDRETFSAQTTGSQDSNPPAKVPAANSADESVTIPTDNATERTLISAAGLNGKGLKWNAMQMPGISNPVQELAEPPAPKQPSMSADDRPRVAIRFGYSPDLSTVGLKDFSKPGTAVSLLVEYAVVPRLFVQSGAVWSRKDYYASADAYQIPSKPHYYPPAMTGIDGVCKVLEVPLNLRYDIAFGERSRWFASGGFSSYHMNSEKYKYYFVDENDPKIQYRGWQGKTGWYLFSHANVSAGYEYRISRKISLLAEPSIRMPLKRVGYGKVNLITTGLWLSVRYTPVFK